MPALVDVLIPVFNGAEFLRQSIESIQAQSLTDIRILVVDDGSTDGTPGILADMAATDRRIEVITQKNGGIVDALNLGLSACNAEFIARHDADDVAYPDRFHVQIDYLKANLDFAAVGCSVRHIDQTGRPIGSIANLTQPELADPTLAPCREPYLIHPFLMVRRAVIQAVGGYRHVYHAEDADLYWRIQEVAGLRNLTQVLGEYRMHSGSISSQSIENGRIMAVSSQLSAISAMRRRAGAQDLAFSRKSIDIYKSRSKDLNSLYEAACEGLTSEETKHFKLVISAKLVELAGYRPYELDLVDCRFIKSSTLVKLKDLTPANLKSLRRQYSGTVARLMSHGKVAEAAALVWPSLLPDSLYRLALRILLPQTLRRQVKRTFLPLAQAIRNRSYTTASPMRS